MPDTRNIIIVDGNGSITPLADWLAAHPEHAALAEREVDAGPTLTAEQRADLAADLAADTAVLHGVSPAPWPDHVLADVADLLHPAPKPAARWLVRHDPGTNRAARRRAARLARRGVWMGD